MGTTIKSKQIKSEKKEEKNCEITWSRNIFQSSLLMIRSYRLQMKRFVNFFRNCFLFSCSLFSHLNVFSVILSFRSMEWKNFERDIDFKPFLLCHLFRNLVFYLVLWFIIIFMVLSRNKHRSISVQLKHCILILQNFYKLHVHVSIFSPF